MTDLYYIEDDPAIAGTVKEYLEQRDFTVTITPTLAQARQALRRHVPALILLDYRMPDGHGDSLCRWIRSHWADLPVIMLTVRGDSCDIVSGFENGADDYVVKPFDLEVLYSRILALLRRFGNTSKRYLSCGGIMIDQDRRCVYCHSDNTPCVKQGDAPLQKKSGNFCDHEEVSLSASESFCEYEEISLSASEYQLLLYLMENKGKTVTRENILAQIWDANGNYVNNNTLTVTMKRLRDKLRQPACLKTVRSVGYRMEDTI